MAFHDPMMDTTPRGSRARLADPFTALEWRVITLARKEHAVASPPAARGWRRLAAWLRTAPQLRPLADERLEALRRLASDLWHGQDEVGSGNLALFRAAGFGDRHLATLQGVIVLAGREAAA
jgi:hypothetical protein